MNDGDIIIDNLYLGNLRALELYGSIFPLIVNCTHTIEFPPKCSECIRLPVNDSPDESKILYDLINESNVLYRIHKAILQGVPVFVHCVAGMQRSCAVVVCYLVKYHLMSPENAIEFVKKQRPIAFHTGINFLETISLIYRDNNNIIN
jgi:protein-tyrosine phosphatase